MMATNSSNVCAQNTTGNFSAFFLEETIAIKLWQIVSPILLVVGLTGNALVILVLKAMKFHRNAALFYFFVLAVADTMVLLVGLFYYWIRETFELDLRTLSVASCRILIFLIYFSMDLSSWTLVAVTIERFIMIKFPLKSASLITIKRARYSVLVVCLLLCLVNGYLLFTQQVESGKCGTTSTDGKIYYFDSYIFIWIDFCTLSLFPSAIMLFCNVAIVRELKDSLRRQQQLSMITQDGPDNNRVQVSSLTLMLLAANVVFLFTTVPISIYFVSDTFFGDVKNSDPHVEAQMDLAWTIAYLIQFVNYTLNFYLYVGRGRRFRRAFRNLLGISSPDLNAMSSERGLSRRRRTEVISVQNGDLRNDSNL